ncbi:hypothetical protein SAMN04487943_103299 [Gracilibacillus orientalis]|uniref:Zinc-finger n=1 Tax=Gracilibacillus orientalis TaxID=334253 RepID=A0A1I4K1X3_9BACI|nr:zf-HC2 domain-containing protein [Gracilibacillus orientalis]SFL72607.1 hypothetical protein SAMN04487943_103299 [Gracilibacillus orientalis]
MKQEIHQLVQELIPLYDEVDKESKIIIDKHVENCAECKTSFDQFEDNFKELRGDSDTNLHMKDNIKPFKLLNRFKISIFFVLIVARLAIIGLVISTWASSHDHSFSMLVANLVFYYFPFVGIVNSVIFIFYRGKFFWTVLIWDLIVLMFLDDILKLFFN